MKTQSNEFLDEIYKLADELNFKVRKIQFSHFRLWKQSLKIDVFINSKKYHVIASNERGVITDTKEFLTLYFGNNSFDIMDILIEERKRQNEERKKEVENMTLDSIMPFGRYAERKIRYIPIPYLKYIYENEYCSMAFMKFLDKYFGFSKH
jgi:uncharacterized protein (DUF3820 family)